MEASESQRDIFYRFFVRTRAAVLWMFCDLSMKPFLCCTTSIVKSLRNLEVHKCLANNYSDKTLDSSIVAEMIVTNFDNLRMQFSFSW